MANKTLWEYRVLGFGGLLGAKGAEIEAGLNELGLDGWEVMAVTLSHNGGKLLAFAKRPLSPSETRKRRDWPSEP